MTTRTIQHSARRGRGFLHLGEIFARLRLERRIARDIRRVEEMSDHDLRDIGMHRGDIPLAVRHGRDFYLPKGWTL